MDVKRAFALLELDETASFSQVKLAYKDLAAVWHPDRHLHNPRLTSKALARMQELNRAFEVVSDHLAASANSIQHNIQEEYGVGQVSCPECGHPVSQGEGVPCSGCRARKPEHEQWGKSSPSKFQVNYDLFGFARKLAAGVLAGLFVGLVLLVVFGGIFSGSQNGAGNRADSVGQSGTAGGSGDLSEMFKVDHFNIYERHDLLQLQRNLAAIGYTVGPIDGIIGPLSLAAVNRFNSDFSTLTPISTPGEVLQFAAMHGEIASIYTNWREIASTGLMEEWLSRRGDQLRKGTGIETRQRLVRMLDFFSFERAAPAALPLPATGELFTAGDGQGVGLLVSARKATRHQLVKVVDPETGRVQLAAFVRSGQVLVTALPEGSYELRRVSGLQWYGKRFLFGTETAHCGRLGSRLQIGKRARQRLELVDCVHDQANAATPLSLFAF